MRRIRINGVLYEAVSGSDRKYPVFSKMTSRDYAMYGGHPCAYGDSLICKIKSDLTIDRSGDIVVILAAEGGFDGEVTKIIVWQGKKDYEIIVGEGRRGYREARDKYEEIVKKIMKSGLKATIKKFDLHRNSYYF